MVEVAGFIDIVKAQTLGFFVFRSPYAILSGRGRIISLIRPLCIICLFLLQIYLLLKII